MDIGAWSIPQDQLALVHKSELVMPAAEAANFRDMLSRGSSPDVGRSISVNPAVHFNVSAMDGQSVSSFLRSNQRAMMSSIHGAVRSGAHLGLWRPR